MIEVSAKKKNTAVMADRIRKETSKGLAFPENIRNNSDSNNTKRLQRNYRRNSKKYSQINYRKNVKLPQKVS